MTADESSWQAPARLLEDVARVIGSSVSEVIPTEAQMHLLNAQRELLLAVAVTIEHNATRTVRSPRAKPRSKRASSKAPAKVKIS